MKLHERLPDSVTVDGRRYRVDLDFRNVLRMMDVLENQDLLPGSRDWLALHCVMRHPPKNAAPVLAALKVLLFPAPKKKGGKRPKITDYAQDADLIRAAFLQTYGINLWRDKLHWLEFIGLMGALPEGSRYAEVLSIRARPLPEATQYNAKERQWLIQAKAEYALEMSENEEQNSYERDLHSMTLTLLALAGKGGDSHGEEL